jgi:phage terminase large subunit-like protein
MEIVDQIRILGGKNAPEILDSVLNQIPNHELAAANYDWGLWARPKQYIDYRGEWRSHGFLTGRGFGKTMANVSHAIEEISAGRAMRVALVGQNETKAIEILVTGETGLLALTPPWLGAEFQPSLNRVVFGNGAIATIYTPESPDGLRGPQHHLAIATEVASWPAAGRMDAMSNLNLGLRLGYGRLLWDGTPKKRNPLVRQLLQKSKVNPAKHIVVFGSTKENEINLSPDVVAEWFETMGGTRQGEEELLGKFFDDEEDALFRSEWIEKSRRKWPEKFTRRIISVDPAITADPRSSDATGIVHLGLGVDKQIYALANQTGVHRPEVWPGQVIDSYVATKCELILVETNRGGNAWAALLRGAAHARGLTLIELGPKEQPGHRDGTVYMRAYTARGQKSVRAASAASLVERGRVSFVVGQLEDLEDRLCSFTGEDGAIDDCVDAFVAGCLELAGLGAEKYDPRGAFSAAIKATAQFSGSGPVGIDVSRHGRGGGDTFGKI